jgi:hypothetical protein
LSLFQNKTLEEIDFPFWLRWLLCRLCVKECGHTKKFWQIFFES